jgi:hypothetical protein
MPSGLVLPLPLSLKTTKPIRPPRPVDWSMDAAIVRPRSTSSRAPLPAHTGTAEHTSTTRGALFPVVVMWLRTSRLWPSHYLTAFAISAARR